MSVLRAEFPAIQVSAGAVGMRRSRLSAAAPRRLPPPEDRCQGCLDSAQKWRSRNPDYWQRYRERHPKAAERNRQRQHVRDQKQRLLDLANNNSAFDLKRSAAEIWLLGAGLQNLANNNSAPAQVWILEPLPPRIPPQSESCKQQRSGNRAAFAG
jgi:hypothetical protein